jgi:hypothetical protein
VASLYFGAIGLFLAYVVSRQTFFLIAAIAAFVGQVILRMREQRPRQISAQPQEPDQSGKAAD